MVLAATALFLLMVTPENARARGYAQPGRPPLMPVVFTPQALPAQVPIGPRLDVRFTGETVQVGVPARCAWWSMTVRPRYGAAPAKP